MRFETKVMAALVAVLVVLTQTAASALPYDPYPWCALYTGKLGGASNCGFLTIEQCRATVRGIGGFCMPNQFYNPGGARPQLTASAAALSFHPTRRSDLSDGRLPKATLSPGMETINLELKGPTNSDEAPKRAFGSLLAGFL